MALARRIFTIQVEIEAPITVGGREICDVLSNAIELGVGENHARHEQHKERASAQTSGLFRDVAETWEFNSPKVLNMRMAEEGNVRQIDTQFGPILVKEEK